MVPEPPVQLEARRASVNGALAQSTAWRMDRFLTRWVAEEVYVKAIPAIESVRDEVEKWLAVPGGGTLTQRAGLTPPEYWLPGVHLTPGGWDGHDLMGTAIAALVYPYVLIPGGVGAVRTGDQLMDQRAQSAAAARDRDHRRITEFGAGSGRFTLALQAAYPEAAVTAVELSETSLRHAKASARDAGWEINWLQADAADTGLPDGSADLVAAYTMLHEVPARDQERIIGEAYRLLCDGGEILISEIAPYEIQGAFRAVVLDWEAENRGEPQWREAMSVDVPALLAKYGFTGIEAFGLGAANYPWIVRARKQEVHA